MTKVPFDWNVFLKNRVIVKLASQEQAKEFLCHFELIPSGGMHTEEGLLELISRSGYDGFRFDKRFFEGHGTFSLYSEQIMWRDYMLMEYDGSHPHTRLVEVGDLL